MISNKKTEGKNARVFLRFRDEVSHAANTSELFIIKPNASSVNKISSFRNCSAFLYGFNATP